MAPPGERMSAEMATSPTRSRPDDAVVVATAESALPAPEKFVLTFITGEENLDVQHVRHISSALASLGKPPAEVHLDVVLSSYGGNPHAAYKLAKILRARCSRVRFFIPESAKSAATLLALSGDEILMSVDAELGPLDMQMEHINLEGMGYLSALEAVKPIDYFINISEKIASSITHVARDHYGLSRKDSLEIALRHADNLLAPIMDKFEPSAVSQAARQLDVSQAYAIDLLGRYHLKNVEANRRKTPSEIAQTLAISFPDHGFVIWRDLAREIGLNVKDAEADDMWSLAKKAFKDAGGMKGRKVTLQRRADFEGIFKASQDGR